MVGNRKAAQAYLLEYIQKLDPSGLNSKLWVDRFATMTDPEFHQFMAGCEAGTDMICLIAPNLQRSQITTANNFKVAKELKYEFFQRIWVNKGDGSPTYLTPKRYLVILWPFRRQAQLLVKKISIPQDNKSINDLTGQPSSSGHSKGSKISYPETQILAALNLDNSIIEMIKYRGGDVKGFAAMNQSIAKTGGVSIDALSKLGTRVKSTDTLKTFLTCMHYQVDL